MKADPNDPQIQYLKAKGKLVMVDKSDDDIARDCFRASHMCVCKVCGKLYIDHPYVENWLDREGHPFLNVICDGSIVKL